MKKIIYLLLTLAAIAGCHKHEVIPESSTALLVTVDPSIGTVARQGLTDTFVVQLIVPSNAIAVPVALHVPVGAIPNLGTGIDDSTWHLTVNATQMNLVTVRAANGDNHKYGIIYNYVFSSQTVAVNGVHVFLRGVSFYGDTMYLPSSVGLFVSTDSGGHFALYDRSVGLGDSSATGIAVQGGVIYLSTFAGLSVSSDWGAHFTNHPFETFPGSGVNVPVNAVYVQGDTIYAGTVSGLEISRDKGVHFTNFFNNGLGNPNVLSVYAKGSTVYAGTSEGLSVSNDGGATFTNYTSGLGNLGGNAQINQLTVQGSTAYCATIGGLSFSASPVAGFTNATTTNGLGSNWTNSVFVQGTMVWAGTNGGLSMSEDGGAHYVNFTTAGNGLLDDIVLGVTVRNGAVYAVESGGLTVITTRH